MADTVGQTDIRGENINSVVKVFAQKKFKLKPLLQHQAEDMLMSFHSIICIPYFDEREKSLEELKQRYVTSNSANKKVKNDS